MIRRRSSCFSPHPVCLMCLTAFLIAMSQPSKGCCCCLGDGFSAISPHWVLVGFFFLLSVVSCAFLLLVKAFSLPKKMQFRRLNWHAICGFLHCYILFSIPGTCIQCVQMTPSCTSSSFQLTGSVLYFVCFLFFPLSVELRV